MTHWAKIEQISRAWRSWPAMNALPTSDRKYGSSASKNAFVLAAEQRLVGVHPGAVLAEQRLGHEGRVQPVLHRVFLDRDPVGHAVVGHLHRVGVAHVDLVLAGADLVVGVLGVDPQLLEREHGLAAQVRAGVERRQVEVAALVEHLGRLRVAEVEVLELGSDVEVVEAHRSRRAGAPGAGRGAGRPRTACARASGCRRTSAPRPASSGRHGSTANVLGSGIAIMSDSSIALKPVIEEPSKPIPPSNASASSVALIENAFSWPRMSVNHRRMKRMSRSATSEITSSAVSGRSVRSSLRNVTCRRVGC